MRNVIVDGRVIEDAWRVVDRGGEAEPGESAVLHVSDAAAHRDALVAASTSFGVWLDGGESIELLESLREHAALVAVRFPSFTDGRGYSTAALIRRAGWQGELRAIGDVLRDQLLAMRRVGFTSFAVREDKDAAQALAAFADFSDFYQGDVDEPRPWFRRRALVQGEAA